MIHTEDSKRIIGQLVQDRLDQLGRSRYWLARQMGVNDARIKQICEGTHEPRFSFVLNLADVLDVSLDYFSAALEKSEIPG